MAKKIAFTLAETLIVMGIIGVVAALTIPNLNSSTADKEKVAKDIPKSWWCSGTCTSSVWTVWWMDTKHN